MRARLAYAQITLCTLTWGSLGAVRKQIDLSSPAIVFFRVAIGALVVATYLAVRGRLRELRPSARPLVLVSSGVVLGVHWIFEFEAFARLDLSVAILIIFIGPVLMAAAAPVVLRERLHLVPVVALAAAFGGIALIAGPALEEIDTRGLVAALISGALFAGLLLQGKLLTEHYASAPIVVWQLGISSLVMWPALLSVGGSDVARALPLMALIGGVYTGGLGIVFFEAVRALPAQRFGVLFYLEPASAVVYAWLLLGERPTALTLVGGVLIVAAGVAIITSDRSAVTASPDLPEPAPAGP